jgi:small conductance mechanosensitive channel
MIPNLNIDWQAFLLDILITFVGAAAILLVGRWLAGFARRWLHNFFLRAKLTPSLREILERSAYYGILLFAISWALVVFGVPAELLAIAVVGIGLAAVLALRESLGDLAATVLFIIFQPFKTGDFIETNGTSGRVQEMLLLHTVLRTSDNRKLIIPNGNIQNNTIINHSVEDYLRVDIPVSVNYSNDLGVVKTILLTLAKDDARVLSEPASSVDVTELGDTGIKLALRVYVNPVEYGAVRSALTERIKIEFDKQQIAFPLAQMELFMTEKMNPDTRNA